MTGFGSAQWHGERQHLTVEIKSLNAKMSDVRVRVPARYRDREIELRSYVLDKAGRGKYDLSIIELIDGAEEIYTINEKAFRQVYDKMSAITSSLNIPTTDILDSIMRVPSVISSVQEPVEDEEWNNILQLVDQAIHSLNDFRGREGNAVASDMRDRVELISKYLADIKPYEQERIDNVRQRLTSSLDELAEKRGVDDNRFEQELIFYLEKLDINEERQRLTEHCKYFLEILASGQSEKGRQLSFLAQEMGREINTIGSKAQHAQIQRFVVKMKDELEKIKEQTANTM